MRLTLYWKLLLGFGIVIVLLGAADAYVLYQLNGVSETTRATVTGDVRAVDLAKQLRSVLYDEERNAQKYLATGDRMYLQLFSDQQKAAIAIIDSLEDFSSDQSVFRLSQSAERRHSWYAQVVAATRHKTLTPDQLAVQQETMMDSLDLVYRDIDELVRQKQKVVEGTVTRVEALARRSAEVATLLAVGAILIAIAIALILTRSITTPLKALMRATDEVAEGTFTRVQGATKGEMGRLADAFDNMGDRLRKANEARAEMMHHISHEIRMPLQTMHSAYYLLSEQMAGPVNDRQRKLLDNIRDNIDKIARFSNQFLDLARIEAGMMEFEVGPTDIGAILRPLVDDASVNAAQKEIAVSFTPGEVPNVQANPDRCSQIFTNLLSNAVKYSNPGGTIQVTLCSSPYGVRVAVADSGVGIPAEELPHVFKKFYRAKTAGRRSGTGIGLALVKALVDAMGGQINVESVPGKGSTFTVDFRTAV